MSHHIEQEHPDFTTKAAMWSRYRDLYTGGEQFRQHADQYLTARLKEAPEVYRERLNSVFYENYIGSIVDWYAATLVRKEPMVEMHNTDGPTRDFYARLVGNCDLHGTTITEFFKQRLVETLICGKSYVAVDFPRVGSSARNRAEEEASGRSRAYMIPYNADEVINWSVDSRGDLEWMVIRTTWLQQDSVKSFGWKRDTRWLYYDRERFEIYERRGGQDSKQVELVDSGPHAFAAIKRVPVYEMRISDGLWLTNKAALLQLEHFNKSNALGWALTMGLFAMPVIYSSKEFSQTMGESYYIQLAPEDRFGWTEPEGKVFQIASNNLSRLKDEIYRVSYLLQQAGETTGAAQSGLSKQWDFSITQEILRSYGDLVKDTMRRVLTGIAAARQDTIQMDVVGLDEFDITDFAVETSNAQSLLSLGIESPTLKRQVFKRVALKYLADSRQEVKNQIAGEIEAQQFN